MTRVAAEAPVRARRSGGRSSQGTMRAPLQRKSAASGPEAPAAAIVRGASRVEFVRALQRTVGHAATVALLARKPAGAPPQAPMPSAAAESRNDDEIKGIQRQPRRLGCTTC